MVRFQIVNQYFVINFFDDELRGAGDGKFVAVGPNAKRLLGTDIRALKDASGKVYGLELYAAAQKPEGQISEVSYMFTRPGADMTPVPKVTFVTKAGDLGCGVGYYK